MRIILILHRYLGVVVGLMMALWCLSGFVMMYQDYPSLAGADRLKGLEPLRLAPAAARPPLELDDDSQLSGFRVEMMADRPTLQVTQGRRRRAFDLNTGQSIDEVDAPTALRIAAVYARGNGIMGQPTDRGVIERNQWTMGVQGAGPVYRFTYGDPAGTELYVAQGSGLAVQTTTRATRFWSWIGAVPHWLYPTVLRSNGKLWTQVVVYASLIGVFLTVTGIYVGIVRFRKYKSGRWSPYRGWFYWHHIIGLVFGVLTLTWVTSGMFTMNPWGFLDTSAGQVERRQLAGEVTGAQVKTFLAAAPQLTDGSLQQIDGAPLGGALYAMAVKADGSSVRIDAKGAPAPLKEPELIAAMAKMGDAPVIGFSRMAREDAYYYSNYDRKAVLPVYRADLGDKGHSTVYIDAKTGRMAFAVDDVGRQSRWLMTGLHDLDFAWLRARPLWDIVVILLLAGVTGGCITGFWLAIKRIGRDVSELSAAAKRKTAKS